MNGLFLFVFEVIEIFVGFFFFLEIEVLWVVVGVGFLVVKGVCVKEDIVWEVCFFVFFFGGRGWVEVRVLVFSWFLF